MTEPPGHRGHPSRGEIAFAHGVRKSLAYTIERLMVNRFSEEEALRLVADHAYLITKRDGETWGDISNSRFTVKQVYGGASGKLWSLGAIAVACGEINELMEDR